MGLFYSANFYGEFDIAIFQHVEWNRDNDFAGHHFLDDSIARVGDHNAVSMAVINGSDFGVVLNIVFYILGEMVQNRLVSSVLFLGKVDIASLESVLESRGKE